MKLCPVSQVWRLVAAFGLVRAVTKVRLVQSGANKSQELVTSVQSQNRNLAILFMTITDERGFRSCT